MKLQEALAAKDPPLALVMWRMEQREKRPLREQVRDTVEVCLEAGVLVGMIRVDVDVFPGQSRHQG